MSIYSFSIQYYCSGLIGYRNGRTLMMINRLSTSDFFDGPCVDDGALITFGFSAVFMT